MISKNKIKLCAKNIVNAINIKKEGECIYITGGTYAHELLEEIGLEVYRKGGLPQISYTTDYYQQSIYQDPNITIKTLKTPHKHYMKFIENIDAYIVIEPLENPAINLNIPRDKLKAKGKALAPIRDILYGAKEEYAPGKKWIYAGWPSKKAAEFYEIKYETLERFTVDGTAVPLEELQEITTKIGKIFNDAKKIYVTDDLGTDFWISVEGRTKILDDGFISDDQIAAGDLGGNLPAGEVFFPPIETMGEGTIFCPLTKDRYTNKIIKGINLVFKQGKLQMDKVTAYNDIDVLKESFIQCEEIDRENNVPELRTYNVAELGIGCNPKINKAIGYILTDEKINGSVHVAFGGNKMMAGTSVSQMHWDFVTTPNVNITVEYGDGTKKSVMSQGKFIS
jgi:aminopeptidase